MKKICTKCGVRKPLNKFSKDKRNTLDGTSAWCIKCHSAKSIEWRRKDQLKNPEKYRRARRRQNARERFGMSLEEYEKRMKHQKCEICGTTESRRYHLDHCHKTGKVRGCLCENCNLGIGKFKDKPELFVNVLMYFNRYK